MFGGVLLGHTLAWYSTQDPPRGWVLALEDEPVAEFAWSRTEGLVRADVDDGVWRIAFKGVLPVRGTLLDSESQPQMMWAGSLRSGLAQSRQGGRFVFFSQLDRDLGPWVGVDDAAGGGVLRVRARVGGGRMWTEVSITPEAVYRSFVGPLLLIWGGLQLLRLHRPWLGFLSSGVSERSVRRALNQLLEAAAS